MIIQHQDGTIAVYFHPSVRLRFEALDGDGNLRYCFTPTDLCGGKTGDLLYSNNKPCCE